MDNDQRFLLTVHVLRSIIIYFRRKIDFCQSLLTSSDPHVLWEHHVHYTTETVQSERVPAPGGEDSRASSAPISMSESNVSSTSERSQTPTTQQPSPHPSSSSLTAGHTPLYRAGRDPLHISPPTACFVQAGGLSVAYGFEYYSPAPQVVLTPSMESAVAATVSAFAQHSFPCVTGDQNTATVKHTAKVANQPIHYQKNLSPCR